MAQMGAGVRRHSRPIQASSPPTAAAKTMSITAQVFFGLWLIPIGYLTNKSGLFPKWLGALLIVGGICYLVDLLTAFLVPDFAQKTHAFVVIPCAVAEISMVVYLLVVGVRTPKPVERTPAPS